MASTWRLCAVSSCALLLSSVPSVLGKDEHAAIQSTKGVQHATPLISDDFVVACIMIMFLMLFAFGAPTCHGPLSSPPGSPPSLLLVLAVQASNEPRMVPVVYCMSLVICVNIKKSSISTPPRLTLGFVHPTHIIVPHHRTRSTVARLRSGDNGTSTMCSPSRRRLRVSFFCHSELRERSSHTHRYCMRRGSTTCIIQRTRERVASHTHTGALANRDVAPRGVFCRLARERERGLSCIHDSVGAADTSRFSPPLKLGTTTAA